MVQSAGQENVKMQGNILFILIFGQKPTQSEIKTNVHHVPAMVVRLGFIVVFISGVGVAFLFTLLPNISTLLGLTSSFDKTGRSMYRLSADERYGILGKGNIPSFHTSTLAVKKPQELEIHSGNICSKVDIIWYKSETATK